MCHSLYACTLLLQGECLLTYSHVYVFCLSPSFSLSESMCAAGRPDGLRSLSYLCNRTVILARSRRSTYTERRENRALMSEREREKNGETTDGENKVNESGRGKCRRHAAWASREKRVKGSTKDRRIHVHRAETCVRERMYGCC